LRDEPFRRFKVRALSVRLVICTHADADSDPA
jgi:hypothetical protein